MKLATPSRTARIAVLIAFALALLCAGELALQHAGGVDRAAPGGSHYLASVEALDESEQESSTFEYLNALATSLFLVSLGMLLGAGLVGRGSERRLLELLRLPSFTPLTPARSPLSALEVFRL